MGALFCVNKLLFILLAQLSWALTVPRQPSSNYVVPVSEGGTASGGATTFQSDSRWTAIDQEIASVKPVANENRQSVQTKCARLSQQAAERGVRVLIFTYEGWGSFSPEATQNMYRAQWELWQQGQTSLLDKDDNFSAGYVVRGTLPNLVKRHWRHLEILSYSYDDIRDQNSTPAICAKQWMMDSQTDRRAANRKIVVIGHSLGGAAVIRMTDILNQMQIPVFLAVPLDAVCSASGFGCAVDFKKYPNVSRLFNFYQPNFIPFPGLNYTGRTIAPADREFQLQEANHFTVPFDPTVWQTIATELALNQPLASR